MTYKGIFAIKGKLKHWEAELEEDIHHEGIGVAPQQIDVQDTVLKTKSIMV